MANTTKSEAPEAEKAQEAVVVSKTVTEADVRAMYNKGLNLYDIAQETFGFQSDEAIERIRRILGIMRPPETRLMDED